MPGPNFSRKQKQRPESRCFCVSKKSRIVAGRRRA